MKSKYKIFPALLMHIWCLLYHFIFLSTVFAVFSTSYHLFSKTPSTVFYTPPIFLYLPCSTPIGVRSLLRQYTHAFGLYERSLQPAYTSHPPTHQARHHTPHQAPRANRPYPAHNPTLIMILPHRLPATPTHPAPPGPPAHASTRSARQWPEVYDLCHTFLHVARVKKPTAMRECDSRMAIRFLTRATCKNVRQNLIPRATAYGPPPQRSFRVERRVGSWLAGRRCAFPANNCIMTAYGCVRVCV